MTTQQRNAELLAQLSRLLNAQTAYPDAAEVRELAQACALPPEQAYAYLLAAAMGLESDRRPEDRALFCAYFPDMLHRLDAREYARDPYYRNIEVPRAQVGKWTLCREQYAPYEPFVCDDLRICEDGRVVPQIGYFEETFSFPAVLENGREWMLITPNEIRTMRPTIAAARGRVLTFGLGLGYFAYMAAEKPEVTQVTVVERDESVIELFEHDLLPQFAQRDKIRVVRGDAFAYAQTHLAQEGYDVVFTDLWHDPSDGLELYLRMKQYEKLSQGSTFLYWIEPTLRYYLGGESE
ncbi:MAG: hypothetical protein PHD32_07690 [Eubacteriales bacterium]|nr:hypothetical protein [Eubacteriales bacterium]